MYIYVYMYRERERESKKDRCILFTCRRMFSATGVFRKFSIRVIFLAGKEIIFKIQY